MRTLIESLGLSPLNRNALLRLRYDVPPSLVTDTQALRWHDAGSELLDDMLASMGLRRLFRGAGVSGPTSRVILANLVIAGRLALREISQRLIAGLATLAGWYRSMQTTAMPLHYATVMTVVGREELVPADRENTKVVVAQQLGFLDRFQAQLISGVQPLNGSILSRSALYASAAWSTGQNVGRDAKIRDGYTMERRILGTVEQHCPECPELANQGWEAIGTLPQIGDTVCRNGCDCHFEFK